MIYVLFNNALESRNEQSKEANAKQALIE